MHGLGLFGVIVVTGALLASTGCKPASPQPKGQWTPTTASAADLEAAKRACTDEAVAATTTIRQEGAATKVAITEYMRCMERRGFRLDRVQ